MVESILTNEKYKGDALLQKRFTVDFLTKKQKVNEGEVTQYYVKDSHPAIISPEIFALVQYEMKQRKKDGRWTYSTYPFSGKVFCGECGGVYGSKVWHSNSPLYRSLVWQCNEKNRGHGCKTPHFTDEEMQQAFLTAFNIRLENREEIFEVYQKIMELLTYTSELDEERAQLLNESEVVEELIHKLVEENAHKAINQGKYEKKYADLCARHEKARKRLVEIEDIRLERKAKKTKIALFLEKIAGYKELVTEYDEELWYTTVYSVTVHVDKRMVFTFWDGNEVEIKDFKRRAVPNIGE